MAGPLCLFREMGEARGVLRRFGGDLSALARTAGARALPVAQPAATGGVGDAIILAVVGLVVLMIRDNLREVFGH